MPHAAIRSQLLTAAFLVLAAFTTWSITSLGHPQAQLTVKSDGRAAASPGAGHRAVIPSNTSRS